MLSLSKDCTSLSIWEAERGLEQMSRVCQEKCRELNLPETEGSSLRESARLGGSLHLELQLVNEGDICFREAVKEWVIAELLPVIPSGTRLISIDGLDGVGKSTLAKALVEKIGAKAIHLDDYLKKNENRYFEALDFTFLHSDIEKEQLIVVEGCLVHAVLARLGIESQFDIYVVRTTTMRAHPETDWLDERKLLLEADNAEEFLAIEEEEIKKFEAYFSEGAPSLGMTVSGLRRELVHYHIDKKPHMNSDVVVKLARIQ
jgi:cytidylate kinase